MLQEHQLLECHKHDHIKYRPISELLEDENVINQLIGSVNIFIGIRIRSDALECVGDINRSKAYFGPSATRCARIPKFSLVFHPA